MSNRFSLLFACLFACIVANAQVRIKLHYNKKWELTTRDSAAFIRVGVYDTVHSFFAGPITDMFLNGKPQMTVTYVGTKKEGECTFYYDNGNIQSTGKFQNNIRVGVWKYFYKDGKLKQEVEFLPNDDFPKVITLNTSDGQPVLKEGNGDWEEMTEFPNGDIAAISGQFKKYLRDGHWKQTVSEGGPALDEWFKNGKFVRGTATVNRLTSETFYSRISSLPLPQKFSTELFIAAPGITFEDYPFLNWMTRNGQRLVKNDPHQTMLDAVQPEPKTGIISFQKFLSQNLHYPLAARDLKIQGTSLVEFFVDETGTASEFKIFKGIGGGCDEEAIRVVREYSIKYGWIPGKAEGRPARLRMILPVKFTSGQ